MPILLKNLTVAQLQTRLAHVGVTPRLARLLQTAVLRRGALPAAAANGFSARVLDKVRALTAIPELTVVDQVVSPRDGFARYVFRGDGPELFEAVRIPLLHRPDDP